MSTPGHALVVEGLRAGVAGIEVLRGVDLSVRSGEVHAVMGPNGSGKSTLAHVLMGKPGYLVLGGSVTLDGADLLVCHRGAVPGAGLFLASQYPTEVPGVDLRQVLAEAAVAPGADDADAEARRGGADPTLLTRPLNVDMSGGERSEARPCNWP